MSYVPTIRFKNNDLNTIINGLGSEQVKSVVFAKFIPNIEQAIKKNKKNVLFCYVGDDYQVIINEINYINTLNILEKYYLEKENYEICAKIKQLKDNNEERRSKDRV